MSLAHPKSGNEGARWFLNTAIKILVSESDGNDGICVVEHQMSRGDAPPLHLHQNEDEIFVVLYGTLQLVVGGHSFYLQTGEAALAPKGVPHSFVVESDGARVLTITRGSDFETMLRTMSRPATAPGLPSQTAPSAEMVTALTQTCRRNNIELVGPPPAAA
jgi:mannose-6-phosphate isomerase-like protein (cupin superfamily)